MVGRKKKNHHLPQRMTARTLKSGRILYYYRLRDGSSIPLGEDLNAAKIKWAELESGTVSKKPTMTDIFERYRLEILPSKSPKSQKENQRELNLLIAAFGKAEPHQIAPKHIRQYLDRRTAKVAGNREIALFSHVFNMAREWGYTDKINPVQGVRKNKESARETYVDDTDYLAIWLVAVPELQDAMDLAFLTGQRPADVRDWRINQIEDGVLRFRQGKTGKKIAMAVDGMLKIVIERALKRPRTVSSMFIVANEDGAGLSYTMLRKRFDSARALASTTLKRPVDWQFRDLRAKSASDSDSLIEAQERLGHENSAITKKVYRRTNIVQPLNRRIIGD